MGTAMIAAQAEIARTTSFCLHAEQRQVRLEDRGQELALGDHLLVDAAGVVGDVAEVAPQLLVHLGNAPRSSDSSGASSGETARWNSITSRLRK